MPVKRDLSVADLVNRLCTEERKLKNAGAYAEAAGIRDAVVIVFRMADEEVVNPPIEPTDPT
jgi:hypothetical protein